MSEGCTKLGLGLGLGLGLVRQVLRHYGSIRAVWRRIPLSFTSAGPSLASRTSPFLSSRGVSARSRQAVSGHPVTATDATPQAARQSHRHPPALTSRRIIVHYSPIAISLTYHAPESEPRVRAAGCGRETGRETTVKTTSRLHRTARVISSRRDLAARQKGDGRARRRSRMMMATDRHRRDRAPADSLGRPTPRQHPYGASRWADCWAPGA